MSRLSRASLALLLPALVLAGPEGMAFLKIAPASREAGMGGVGAASGFGPVAMVWNPAATAGLQGFAASAGYCVWFLGTHQQSAFVVRDLRWLRAGLGVSSFAAGPFEYRDDVPTEEPRGTFEPVDLTAYVNAALPVGAIGAAGVSGRYYYSRIATDAAAGFGADLGLRLSPLAGLTLGAAVTDFGTTLTYERDKAWLPTRARLGAAYALEPLNQRLVLAADGSYFFYSARPNLGVGAELELAKLVRLRAGYDFLAGASRMTFGLGLRAGRLGVDYSLAPLNYGLGSAHRISLGVGY